MIVNWARQPMMMSFGRVKTSAKSSILSVSPIPNMTSIKSGLIQDGWIQRQLCGTKSARAATAKIIKAMNFPKKFPIFSKTDMMYL